MVKSIALNIFCNPDLNKTFLKKLEKDKLHVADTEKYHLDPPQQTQHNPCNKEQLEGMWLADTPQAVSSLLVGLHFQAKGVTF